jgi:hypothetical protein
MEEMPLMDAEESVVRENTGLEKDEILFGYKNLQADVVVSAARDHMHWQAAENFKKVEELLRQALRLAGMKTILEALPVPHSLLGEIQEQAKNEVGGIEDWFSDGEESVLRNLLDEALLTVKKRVEYFVRIAAKGQTKRKKQLEEFYLKESHATTAAAYVEGWLIQGGISKGRTRKGTWVMFYLGYYDQPPSESGQIKDDPPRKKYQDALREVGRNKRSFEALVASLRKGT